MACRPTSPPFAVDPSPLTRRLTVADDSFTFRALRADELDPLTSFLARLSVPSRRFWHGEVDDAVEAATWIDAIGRYDKLRIVVHRVDRPDHFDAIVDLSFSVPDFAEGSRYESYGIGLDPVRTVRFGPCVANEWQGRGLAAQLLEPTWDAVRLLGCDRVVLYGGVHADNHRARRFYLRHGFVEVGAFTSATGDGIDMLLDLT